MSDKIIQAIELKKHFKGHEIKALDGVSLDIADIADTHPESQERRVRKMLLCECAKLSEDEADKLIRYDREACYAIIAEIFNLRQEFVDAQKAEREKAKKNSVAEIKMDTQV